MYAYPSEANTGSRRRASYRARLRIDTLVAYILSRNNHEYMVNTVTCRQSLTPPNERNRQERRYQLLRRGALALVTATWRAGQAEATGAVLSRQKDLLVRHRRIIYELTRWCNQ